MARASIHTLLPLDEFARILGISPFDFNQFAYPGPKSPQCSDVFFQWQWQKDHLGREEAAQAIADAEHMIADQLRYWPAPKHIVDETVQYPRPYQSTLYGAAGTPRGNWKTIQAQWHKVISGGVLNRTAIDTIESSDIEVKDLDADGVLESFIATVTVPSGTNPLEIGVYFTEADRLGETISETWRIRPLKITVSGTTATIRGHYTQLVKPNVTFDVAPEKLAFDTGDNFVSSMEVYRVFTDTTATEANPYQGVAVWDNNPSCVDEDCTFSIKELCLGTRDNDQGRVAASFGQPCDWPDGGREPDRLQINYLAGLPLENGQMQPEMARCVTYLAVALLANEKCGCERTNRILAHWQEPILTFEDNANRARGFSKDFNDLPFPSTRGGLFAWQRVKQWRHLEAISL